ncbi:MAG: TlpA disulfide reductase family protein [Planctomycetaceae bacterium]
MIKSILPVTAILLLCSVCLSADDSTLVWSNGDSLNGTLLRADDKVVVWESPLFNDPLQIAIEQLSLLKYPAVAEPVTPPAGFRILTRNGDLLFGTLKSANETSLTFESSRFGAFEIPRNQLVSLQGSTGGGGVIYSGPRGLDGWQPAFRRETQENGRVLGAIRLAVPAAPANPAANQDAEKPVSWSEDPEGGIMTNRADAALFLPQKLPQKFEIEVELHSKKTLSFALAIGRDAKAGLRLESWVDVLVAANGNKFASLQQISEKDHFLHVHVFVDYTKKIMQVYNPAGQKLGEVAITGLRGGAEGILLRNGEWDLSLRRLRISNWDGSEPRFAAGKENRVQMVDGTVHFGAIQSFSPDTSSLVIMKEGAELPLPVDQVASLVLAVDEDAPIAARGATHVVWADGGFVSGSLVSIADGRAVLQPTYSQTPLNCDLTNALRIGLTPGQKESTQSDRLFHAGGSLQGSLVVDGEADTPIQWKPLGGLNASTLKNGGDARFVRADGMKHFSENPEMLASFPDVIYLKNNDVLPCRVEGCTVDQIQLALPFSEVKTFAREHIKAVELAGTGRIHQRGFGAEGWRGVASLKVPKKAVADHEQKAGVNPMTPAEQMALEKAALLKQMAEPNLAQVKPHAESIVLRGNASASHPSILTGDTVRFHMKWPVQSYANLTISLFGSGNRKDETSTHVSFSLMQTNLQVLDRLPPQNQMFFRGFGGQNAEEIIRAASGEVDVQLVARDGNLLVSIDGKQVKTIKLNPDGAGSKGLAFNANVTMTGRVIMNGQVQQSNGDGVEISRFEIDNMSGASIRQFIEEEARLATLTVPRFRRDNPPTHVLIAANGDLLRGQLKSIREADVQFESRLETLRVDRLRVAAIVWLDPPKKDSGKKVEKAAAENSTTDQANAAAQGGETKVAPAVSEATVEEDTENGFVMGDEDESSMQAMLADGFSITMTPARLENGQIKGHSKLLGDCAFPAATIRELFLGDPDSRTSIAAFDQWIARNAQEPDWDIAAESGGASEGAAMIGQVADDFELSLLDGSKFRLKDHADKIIVLDFWATWCGPCVAALPDYIAATSEFDSSTVIFVAVNQQEASDQIRGFLTERNLSPIVALDRSGAIGQQFKVSGIPHTVILGKGNVIEDVHVGYQQGGGESMQIAIQQLLDGTWKRPTPEAAPAKPLAPPKEPI